MFHGSRVHLFQETQALGTLKNQLPGQQNGVQSQVILANTDMSLQKKTQKKWKILKNMIF
jgi:hypothetical protein